MKIVLIGYGRMGREIHSIALERGHTVALIVDMDNSGDLNRENLMGADVAIEFSHPESAPANIIKCISAGIPVVSGTTGWLDKFDDVRDAVKEYDGTFLYASNFSIGVNIFFSINRKLSLMMKDFSDYIPSISEVHHTRKLDSPSGTAITLAGDIAESTGRDGWIAGDDPTGKRISVFSERTGDITGIHEIEWKSGIDRISLKHEAFNRSGFAAGAVFAAESVLNRKGLLTMSDLLGF